MSTERLQLLSAAQHFQNKHTPAPVQSSRRIASGYQCCCNSSREPKSAVHRHFGDVHRISAGTSIARLIDLFSFVIYLECFFDKSRCRDPGRDPSGLWRRWWRWHYGPAHISSRVPPIARTAILGLSRAPPQGTPRSRTPWALKPSRLCPPRDEQTCSSKALPSETF